MAFQLAGFVFIVLVAYSSANNNTDANYDKHFLITTSNGYIRVYSSDFSTYETLRNPGSDNESRLTLDYHYSKRLIFICATSYLFKATFNPQTSTADTVTNAQQVTSDKVYPGFAVDWVQDHIYWADYSSGAIKVCGLNGEAQQTVLSRPNSFLHSMEIDPYKGILFWTEQYVIQSVETSGEGFNPNVTKAEVQEWALALDLRLQRVYYVGYKDETLHSMDYAGGEKMKHFSVPQLEGLLCIRILGDKVFWDIYRDINPMHKFYEAPLNLTRIEDVKILKELNLDVTHMRVMHPSLQMQPEIDPCLAKGCAHSCKASGTTTAVCECPPGQALNNDGVSCHNITEDKSHLQTTEYAETESEITESLTEDLTNNAVSVTTESLTEDPTSNAVAVTAEPLTDVSTISTEYSPTQISPVIQNTNSHLLYIVYCVFILMLVVGIPLLVYTTFGQRLNKMSHRPHIVYSTQFDEVQIT